MALKLNGHLKVGGREPNRTFIHQDGRSSTIMKFFFIKTFGSSKLERIVIKTLVDYFVNSKWTVNFQIAGPFVFCSKDRPTFYFWTSH